MKNPIRSTAIYLSDQKDVYGVTPRQPVKFAKAALKAAKASRAWDAYSAAVQDDISTAADCDRLLAVFESHC